MSKSMKFLFLASALSLATVSAVQAGGKPVGSDFHSGASAAPVCEGTGRSQKTANDGRLSRDWCRVIATEGPGNPTDGTGRSADAAHAYPALADDTGLGNHGHHNGRSAELAIDTQSMLPGCR